jgi:hypothetical protein
MLIEAADGLVLRDPATKQRLATIDTLAPALRAIVEQDATPVLATIEVSARDPHWLFWDRRLRDGDVVCVTEESPAVPMRRGGGRREASAATKQES